MDNEEKSVSGEDKKEGAGKSEEKSSNDKAKSELATKAQTLTAIAAIIAPIAAIIGATATLIAAVLGFQPFVHWLQSTPTPTYTPISTSSPTPFITDTLTPFTTDTITPFVLPSLTDTPTLVGTPTNTPEPSTSSPRLFVNLVADKTSGKPPLVVKFNARSSYLLTPDGIQHPCQNGPCHYTWKVYSNGQQSGKSITDSGFSFDHTFSAKGSYIVTVQVCWGQERLYCADDGTSIEVAR